MTTTLPVITGQHVKCDADIARMGRALDYLVERFEALGREAADAADAHRVKQGEARAQGLYNLAALHAREGARLDGMAQAFDVASGAAAGSR